MCGGDDDGGECAAEFCSTRDHTHASKQHRPRRATYVVDVDGKNGKILGGSNRNYKADYRTQLRPVQVNISDSKKKAQTCLGLKRMA